MHIVLCYIEVDLELLLIKRKNDPYKGYLALLGGKIKDGELVLEAAIREAEEESGLCISSGRILGVASEVVVDASSASILYQYDMTLVKLETKNKSVIESDEGELSWMRKDSFMCSGQVVPTDVDLVRRYLIEGQKESVRYTVEVSGGGEYSIISVNNMI